MTATWGWFWILAGWGMSPVWVLVAYTVIDWRLK